MTPANPVPTDSVVHAFVASTRNAAALFNDSDPASLGLALQKQLDAFEALKAEIESGRIADPSVLSAAIEEGQQTLEGAQRRMREIHDELEDLRSTRARTSRRPAPDTAARFISRRV